ncbi:2'-5' RNA ligase [Alloactinosynnema sp. L-07]|uniref:2'-5' RNA ligase family protein n=1 Tax=Alloactinosynnema sp. L-07 TaxID=1653480 RepID=UPI00065F07BD|nr:2'-5' RNA ligase family protein [Alloactinosynnema sp. L-07]CRK58520.1 2'-5' RNA ligase [Alloactinosynnema sp. L-07]
MRLFSAFPLPDEVADHLADHLPKMPGRPTARHTWHITVVYYGESTPPLIPATLRAPRLRLTGSGSFPGVAWVGVETTPELHAIVKAAGGDPEDYIPHVTLARWPKRHRASFEADYTGPEWIPTELVLYRSDPGPVYTPIHQVGLLHAE